MRVAEYEDEADDDKTIRLNKREKSQRTYPSDALLADETISLITTLGSHRVAIELNIRVRPL